MQKDFLPDAKIKCHRTGFKATCRKCVVDHGCQLWKRMHGKDYATGEAIDVYGCVDKFQADIQAAGVAQLTQKLEIVAGEVNALRQEVQGKQVEALARTIVDINKTVREARALGVDPVKMIGPN